MIPDSRIWRTIGAGARHAATWPFRVAAARATLKALSVGAKAVGIGRYYLFPLAAGGETAVERALRFLRTEIERDLRLMGCARISELSRENLRFR